jgi:NADH:ubiquinone oxidoreductase subunit 6 (subunit J)
MVKSYEELNQDEIQGNITISQNYSSFILLLILAVLLIVVLYMFSRSSSSSDSSMIPQQPTPTNMQGGQLGISTYFIVFVIIIIVLVIKYFSNISSFIKSYY